MWVLRVRVPGLHSQLPGLGMVRHDDALESQLALWGVPSACALTGYLCGTRQVRHVPLMRTGAIIAVFPERETNV